MPQRLLPYRTASFVGFVGILLFAVVGLARLPALGPAETAVHGLAWIGVAAAAIIMGRAWWNLAPEIFGTRMPLVGFVLLVLFVAWVWVWFAIVLVKCEGYLRTCGPWRIALDLGAFTMWATLAWIVWWRTRRWMVAALVVLGNIGTRLPIYVSGLPAWTRPLGITVFSVGLILVTRRCNWACEGSGMEIYRGLLYPHLREAHDRIYFGAWRGSSPTLGDLVEARRQLESFLDALEKELQQASPPGAREYQAKAREAYRQVEPESAPGPAVLLAINNALSYGHRVLDRLLRAKGEGNHVSRAFAGYYDASGVGDE